MATARQHPPIKKKVYVQRDYSTGMKVSFNSRMPEELDGKVKKLLPIINSLLHLRFVKHNCEFQLNPEVFKRTIDRLNELYNEAETITSWTLCEGCLACLTAYSLYLCIDTQYEKVQCST